jgi:hypothetical protein
VVCNATNGSEAAEAATAVSAITGTSMFVNAHIQTAVKVITRMLVLVKNILRQDPYTITVPRREKQWFFANIADVLRMYNLVPEFTTDTENFTVFTLLTQQHQQYLTQVANANAVALQPAAKFPNLANYQQYYQQQHQLQLQLHLFNFQQYQRQQEQQIQQQNLLYNVTNSLSDTYPHIATTDNQQQQLLQQQQNQQILNYYTGSVLHPQFAFLRTYSNK